ILKLCAMFSMTSRANWIGSMNRRKNVRPWMSPWRTQSKASRNAIGRAAKSLPLKPPVRFVPLRLAVDASGRIRQRLEPLRRDLSRAVLANAVAAFGDPSPRMLGLDRVLVENAMNLVGGGPVSLHLGVVGASESLAHVISCLSCTAMPAARGS